MRIRFAEQKERCGSTPNGLKISLSLPTYRSGQEQAEKRNEYAVTNWARTTRDQSWIPGLAPCRIGHRATTASQTKRTNRPVTSLGGNAAVRKPGQGFGQGLETYRPDGWHPLRRSRLRSLRRNASTDPPHPHPSSNHRPICHPHRSLLSPVSTGA